MFLTKNRLFRSINFRITSSKLNQFSNLLVTSINFHTILLVIYPVMQNKNISKLPLIERFLFCPTCYVSKSEFFNTADCASIRSAEGRGLGFFTLFIYHTTCDQETFKSRRGEAYFHNADLIEATLIRSVIQGVNTSHVIQI